MFSVDTVRHRRGKHAAPSLRIGRTEVPWVLEELLPIPRVEREEIQAVDVNVHVGEKLSEIRGRNTPAEQSQLDLGVDVARHSGKHFDLGLLERGHRGAGLPIEVGEIEYVVIGNVELADAKAGKG